MLDHAAWRICLLLRHGSPVTNVHPVRLHSPGLPMPKNLGTLVRKRIEAAFEKDKESLDEQTRIRLGESRAKMNRCRLKRQVATG